MLIRKKRRIFFFCVTLVISYYSQAQTKSSFFKAGERTIEIRFTKKSNGSLKNKNFHFLENHQTDICTEVIEESEHLYPSWTIARTNDVVVKDNWDIKCLEDDEPIEGCMIQFDLKAEGCDGRHSEEHIGSRPVGHMTGKTEITLYDIPLAGLPFEYNAPDTAGDVLVDFTVFIPTYPAPFEMTLLFRIGFPDFVNLQDTLGLSTYLTFNNITSHPNDVGTYGVFGFGNGLYNALQDYVTEAASRPISVIPSYTPLNSEGVSLQFGGLFDINKDWNYSHKRHRQGVDIDIGMSLLKAHPSRDELMQILDFTLTTEGFIFDVPAESIDATLTQMNGSNFHWHVRNPFGELVNSNDVP